MKKLTEFLLCLLPCLISTSQVVYKSPMDLVKSYSFTIYGNMNGPVDSKIILEENDYVFIEATGEIKIGNYLGNADATGLLSAKLFFSRYLKYPDIELGSLVILTKNGTTGCKKIFREIGETYNIVGITDYDTTKITQSFIRDYLPGYYFVSPGKTPLYFDINDNILDDNTGKFTVNIYVIKYKDHLNRNFFNYCPKKEPENGTDIKLLTWKKENPIFSSVYHGALNSSYRGGSFDNAGCQCVYGDIYKTLIENEVQQGSFDLGLWIYRGKTNMETTKNYFHLLLDVIPHDLYVKKFGKQQTTYKVFRNNAY
jgi:hypothetical protein